MAIQTTPTEAIKNTAYEMKDTLAPAMVRRKMYSKNDPHQTRSFSESMEAKLQSSDQASRLQRALRFLTSILTGGAATMVDFGVLTGLVELLHVSPTRANIPSLLAGATIQFVGNRHMVFKVGHLAVRPQLLGFIAVEVGTFALNAVSYHLLVKLTGVPYPIARLLCSFLVFSTFSYPLWKRVFSTRSTAPK